MVLVAAGALACLSLTACIATRARDRAPALISMNQSMDFTVGLKPELMRYWDSAANSPAGWESVSAQAFSALKESGYVRQAIYVAERNKNQPMLLKELYPGTALQYECQGACEYLILSIREPNNRGMIVSSRPIYGFPMLHLRNPTLYPQQVELNCDDSRVPAGQTYRLKITEWRRTSVFF